MFENPVVIGLFLLLGYIAFEVCFWCIPWRGREDPEDEHEAEGMKEACRYDFMRFCDYYFAESFAEPWTANQTKAIAGLQSVILFGGEFPHAMRSEEDATSLIKAAAIWAAAYRHRASILVLTDQASSAASLRHQVKDELWNNERLWKDFFPTNERGTEILTASITESLIALFYGCNTLRTPPDLVLADSIEGNTRSFAEVQRRRQHFKRVTDAQFYKQKDGHALAVASIRSVEPGAIDPEEEHERNLAAIRQESKGLTVSEFVARHGFPSIKAGQAFVNLGPQGDPPAAPRSE